MGESLPVVTPAAAPRVPPILTPQTPSAIGIATAGATLLEQPGGGVVRHLALGEVATVTGQSADGRYLAAYTNDGATGWVAAGQLTLYGATDLVVVTVAAGPGPIATLLAEAMQPITVLETLVATPAASPSSAQSSTP
jgi:hypothetical protein